MVKLQLEVVMTNLNKIKENLQKSFENMNGGGTGGARRGPGATTIAAAVSILDQILKSTESIVGFLSVIGGLLNQLVAPFVPILLGLIKPVMVVLQKFLFMAMSSLGFSGFGGDGGDISTGEFVNKFFLGLAAALAGIAATIATVGTGWAIAIGVALFALVPILFDLGKKLAEKLGNVGASIGDFLAEGLRDISQFIFDIFGIDLLTPLKEIATRIVDIFASIGDFYLGIFNFDLEQIKEGWLNMWKETWDLTKFVFMTAIDLLWEILKSAWDGIKSVFEFLLQALKDGITSFANLFIKGLNGLIALLNKIPGVDIGRVSSVGASNLQTTINVTVQGNTNDDTVDQMLRALRREQVKRGTGSL